MAAHRAHGVRTSLSALEPPPAGPFYAAHGLTNLKRLEINRYLCLGWHEQEIADQALTGKLGRPPKLAKEDSLALRGELLRHGWMYQDEMVWWLSVERGIFITQSTISRLLKREGWGRKTLRPYAIDRNEELRGYYRDSMRRYAAEDVVFLDESIFNEKTGWRHHAYAPIGEEMRYTQDIKRDFAFEE
ncbi:TPR domain-containing protein [Paraphaeosphaeria minitans]|uniref:TPR domain-containing protein n=1 Tax=Paraphaeosphaeria minitans TaxID=565426 RepID=A0A9P6KKW8_9PLEO|nr:TPR domain-containing protein [Paraphaeosphaeria minitans]